MPEHVVTSKPARRFIMLTRPIFCHIEVGVMNREQELKSKIQRELDRKRAWERVGDLVESELCAERIDGYLLELKDTTDA